MYLFVGLRGDAEEVADAPLHLGVVGGEQGDHGRDQRLGVHGVGRHHLRYPRQTPHQPEGYIDGFYKVITKGVNYNVG